MKTAIIYRSFTGITRQYAQWLAESVQGEVLTFGQASGDRLRDYDAVVIMSGTYCSWMPLVSFLKKCWEAIKDKKVAVAAVGVIPPQDQGSQISYNRIPEHIRAAVKYWKLPGKMGKKESTDFGPVARENLDPIIAHIKDS